MERPHNHRSYRQPDQRLTITHQRRDFDPDGQIRSPTSRRYQLEALPGTATTGRRAKRPHDGRDCDARGGANAIGLVTRHEHLHSISCAYLSAGAHSLGMRGRQCAPSGRRGSGSHPAARVPRLPRNSGPWFGGPPLSRPNKGRSPAQPASASSRGCRSKPSASARTRVSSLGGLPVAVGWPPPRCPNRTYRAARGEVGGL
jgi:hypothetical protein